MKAQCLPFRQIPHTTPLFTDFLSWSPSIQPFYSRSPHFSEWLKDETAAISYDSARRAARGGHSGTAEPGLGRFAQDSGKYCSPARTARPRLSPDNRSDFSAVRCFRFQGTDDGQVGT